MRPTASRPTRGSGRTPTSFPEPRRRPGQVLPTNGDNIAQDNEIGPRQNNRFGLAPEQRADPDLQREYSWDYSASVQHEIRPNLSVMAGWYYARTYDAQQTINVLRSLSDYAPFQVVNPYIPTEMVTIFRLNNNKLGVVDNVTTNSSVNHRDYQAYEASVTSRLLSGGTINVGWAMERSRRVSCDTPNPNQLRFCDHTGQLYQELGPVPEIPYRHEFKFSMAQELPYAFNVGASFVSFAGANRLVGAGGAANVVGSTGSVAWAVPAALFPGGITEPVTVPLLAPGVLVPRSMEPARPQRAAELPGRRTVRAPAGAGNVQPDERRRRV